MDKKIILLKDLDKDTRYPVVDLLTSTGERLGCSTTGLINWVMKLDLFDDQQFSNVAEMALFYEKEFKVDRATGGTEAKTAFEVIDGYREQNKDLVETIVYRADTANLGAILFLLANDFVGLICSQTKDGGGHCDILFKEEDKVFYNAFEVNLEQMAEIMFSNPYNMFCFGRNLKKFSRLTMLSRNLGEFKIKLTEKDKYMLSPYEVFFLENDLLEMFDNFPQMPIPELLKRKEYLLKNLGYIPAETIIIYPRQ